MKTITEDCVNYSCMPLGVSPILHNRRVTIRPVDSQVSMSKDFHTFSNSSLLKKERH